MQIIYQMQVLQKNQNNAFQKLFDIQHDWWYHQTSAIDERNYSYVLSLFILYVYWCVVSFLEIPGWIINSQEAEQMACGHPGNVSVRLVVRRYPE